MEDHKERIEQLSNDSSFIRWVEGKADRREAEQWNKWIQQNEKNREIALRARHKVSGFAFKKPLELPDTAAEWDRVRHEIEEGQQKEATVTKLTTSRKRWDVTTVLFKAAAVLLIGSFVGLVAYMYQEPASEKQEIEEHIVKTGYGETKTINISDGSQIILSANSQISYKENWLEKPVKRLDLEGEAFFAIAPQSTKTHPKLVVETEDGSASVWGTRFTMDTYGKGTRIVLEEGEVQVKTKSKKEIRMSPGEMAKFRSTSSKISLKKVNPKVYTSWSKNKLFFDNTPLSVLIHRIERTYGVDVEVLEPEILKKKLSGSVDFRSLDGLTSAVAEIFGIQIQQSGEKLIIK